MTPRLSPSQTGSGELQTVSVTRTLVLPLETSTHKNAHLRPAIDEFQAMTAHASNMVASMSPGEWNPKNTTIYRFLEREFGDDRTVLSTVMNEARRKVAEAYSSWASNGMPGDRPASFGHGHYVRQSNRYVTIEPNDRGWGLHVQLYPYSDGVWFHIDDAAFHRELLERVTDDTDDARVGSIEFHLDPETGDLAAHTSIVWDVDVHKADTVETVIGVDLNYDPLACVAVLDVSDDDVAVEEVIFDPGEESSATWRHHRKRIAQSRDQAQRDGNLRAVTDARRTWYNYTDHITNVLSRRIVECALDHTPAVLVFEDLTNIRDHKDGDEFDHGWPFAQLKEQTAYKATEAGIPFEDVDPAGTSTTCRMCETTNSSFRRGRDFECGVCGYTVHADVNAAINIAQRYVEG